ncbi:MAG TPA: metallophosphoesterase [Kofleriaceae bacterium]|nr:metallophosphoesterase [Kofleriaceae bacterium]
MHRLLWLAWIASACTRPSESRAVAEFDVGKASISGATVEVRDGLAAIRDLTDHRIELWASAPAITLDLSLDAGAAGEWTIVARNTLVDAQLAVAGLAFPVVREPGDRTTVATFKVTLPSGASTLAIAPPDAATPGPFRVAAMADIQTALPVVDDVFTMISAVPELRFVVAMGDITERGTVEEYDLFERQLETLAIPYYTTLGNHELWGPHERFFDRFGRASFHFEFKGCAFTFVDSGDAGIDPIVEDQLAGWLSQSIDQPHVFLTHIPPIDPVGLRYGGFRSGRDARRLLAMLGDAKVDLTLYGHIHTFIDFENAGMPAYISGGGGAEPMKGDGIYRHFLVVELDATIGDGLLPLDPSNNPLRAVELHRVD